MRHRFILRVAAVAAALLLCGPAAAMANRGGHSHSAKSCPAHKHSGKHHGTKGHRNGSTKGKKCSSADFAAFRKNANDTTPTLGDDDQGDQNDQGDVNDDTSSSGDDQGDQNDQGDDNDQGDQNDQGDTTDDQGDQND